MKPPKIIQSFWTKPSLTQNDDSIGGLMERNMGGWLDTKYCYMSWALSCLTIRKIYPDVELITDTLGKLLLIDKLELPYTKVSVELDKLNYQDNGLWATAKLCAYKLQNEPFIHLDGDVFIWKRFEKKIESAELIAQNIEINFQQYFDIWNQIEKNFGYIPSFMLNDFKNNNGIIAANAGIFGGANFKFIHDYVDESKYFLEKNIKFLKNIDLGHSGLIYEQYLFSCYARKHKKNVCYLFEEIEPKYSALLNFIKVRRGADFIHIVGNMKREIDACIFVENRLILEYPEYYYKIIRLFS